MKHGIIVRLRPAEAADARAIAALHIESWRATYRAELSAAFLHALDPDERTRLWQERLATHDLHVLIAEIEGGAVGFCSCGFTQPADASAAAWEIVNLHVTPRLHGGGVGSRLFDAAVRLGHEHGARDVVLWVVATNRRAREFYERKGMQLTGAQQVHELGAGSALSEVRYTMPVTHRQL